MEHQEIRRSLSNGIRAMLARQDTLPKQPRPYQVETLESCVRWLDNPEASHRAYVNHATGLGKTILFAIIVAAASDVRSLVIVPTKALLEQTARKVVQFTGGLLGHISSLANIQDEVGEEIVAVRGMAHSPVVLTTDASFNKFAAKIRAEFDPHLIIRDECHWGYAAPAIAALEQFPEAIIIGFSATPDYLTSKAKDGYLPVQLENGRTLYGPRDRFAETHFQTCLDRRTVRWGIENGWLAPLAWGFVEFDISLKSISIVDTADGPDYQPDKLQELMGKHWTVMCETIRRLYEKGDYDLPNRQVFAVCPSVLAAQELTETIASLGIASACITGASSTIERNVILPAFNESEIRFLTSVMVLREGWDAPPAEVCMMLRPTVSRVLYEQSIGRGLRLSEGNPDKVALVLDAHFQGKKLCPLSAPAIYGEPGEEIHVGDILMGPHTDGGEGDFKVSPYLPKNADPRIVIVEMLDHEDTEPRVGNDGFAQVGGRPYGTVASITKSFGLSHGTVSSRIKRSGLDPIAGRDAAGKRAQLFDLEQARTACADLLEVYVQADTENVIVRDGVRSSPLRKIAVLLGRDEATIKTRVTLANISGFRGKGVHGRIQWFYPIEQIRACCDGLLEKLPTMEDDCPLNADGTFMLNGLSHGTINVFMGVLGLSSRAIRNRIKRAGLSAVRASDRLGRVLETYPVDEVRRACQDLLNVALSPDDKGFLQHQGSRFGNLTAIAESFGVSQAYVSSVLRRHPVPIVSAKNRAGRAMAYFDVEALRALMAEKLETALRTDQDGQVEIDDQVWMSRQGARRKLGVSYSTLERKMELCPPPEMRKALDVSGHVVVIYPFEYLRKLCTDLTTDRPQLDLNGSVLIDGRECFTIRSIMKRCGVSDSRLWACIAKFGLTRHTAYLQRTRRVVDVFCLEEVQRALAESRPTSSPALT